MLTDVIVQAVLNLTINQADTSYTSLWHVIVLSGMVLLIIRVELIILILVQIIIIL